MKKLIILITLLCTTPCHAELYTTHGTYYTNNTVITNNGHIWDYSALLHDNTPVCAIFDDNNTHNITDDSIITLLPHYISMLSTPPLQVHTIDGYLTSQHSGYLFTSHDQTLTWYLTSDDIDFVPEPHKTYTLTYHDNGTSACDCEMYDDVFITINEKR